MGCGRECTKESPCVVHNAKPENAIGMAGGAMGGGSAAAFMMGEIATGATVAGASIGALSGLLATVPLYSKEDKHAGRLVEKVYFLLLKGIPI